jgi:dUTP pyrophosphatase
MEVKIKKLQKDSVIPHYAKDSDARLDLTATRVWFEDSNVCYGTGLAMEIPKGYVGLIFPRSSNAKKELLLCNSVGVIDSNYRGEIMVKFKTINGGSHIYSVGERIGQIIIMPYPQIEFKEVEELSETNRGDGGFGSTGK